MRIVCVLGRVHLVLFSSSCVHSMQRSVWERCVLSRVVCHVCAQGRSSSRKKAEAAANEDQDKPYVCDSKEKQRENNTVELTCVSLDAYVM